MKLLFTLFVVFVHSVVVNAQSFDLTVNNGYGSGTFQVGDTVHVWSVAYDSTQVFGQWNGDVQFLAGEKEWHTTLIMPNQDVTVTAVINNMPAYSIIHEQIMGVNNLKNVYYYFPNNPKGIIYLFHGTGGSAGNFVYSDENRSFVNSAIADGFAIVSTESEETTLNQDINLDGTIRWMTNPIDTVTNPDYLNIKTLHAEFINRNWISSVTPRFSVGMSAGSNFSAAVSNIFNFKAGAGYCSKANNTGINTRLSPWAFRLAKYDDNPSYNAPLGHYEAFQNDSTLEVRGICHDMLIHNRQPIYPERFARVLGISIANSQAIFNELLTNNQIDANNFALNSNVIKANVQGNPSAYPIIVGLLNQGLNGLSQIAASNAEHNFYSDYNYETLKFFNELCAGSLDVKEEKFENELTVFPNPFSSKINVKGISNQTEYILLNVYGEVLWSGRDIQNRNFSNLPGGVYFLKVGDKQKYQKLLKY